MFKKFIKNKNGNTILMAMLMLSGILVVVLTASDLVIGSLRKNKIQSNSVKAFFAAESGAEKALWSLRKSSWDFSSCSDTKCLDLDNSPVDCANCNQTEETLSNNSTYNVHYSYISPDTYFTSVGDFEDISRSVEVGFTQ